MRVWGLRALFAGLLLGTLAAKIQASPEPERDIRPAVVELLAARGLAARTVPVQDNALLRAVVFNAPGCEGNVHVFPVELSLQEAPLFDAALGEGRVRHFAYLGRTWREPDRIELRLEWLKHKALSIWGLGPYTTNTTALLIAEPSGCRVAESIDWGPLWYRPQSKS